MNRRIRSARPFIVLNVFLVVVLTFALSFGNAAPAFADPPQTAGNLTIVKREGKEIARREVLPPRTWLGLSPLELTVELREHFGAPRDAGVLVQSLRPDSPAAHCGVQVGDVVISIDREPIAIPWDLGPFLAGTKPGQTVLVELVREKVHFNIPVQLDVMPIEMRTIIYSTVEPVAVDIPPPPAPAPRRRPNTLRAKLKELDRQIKEIEKAL